MENVSYDIKEKKAPASSVDIESLMAEFDAKTASPAPLNIQDKAMALELEYSTNYTVKQLSQILDYYEISKRKLRKDEMVQILVMFETDAQNASLVSRRKRLWANAQELREDPYFAKFIVFNI